MAKITEKMVVSALDWAYDKAINGLPGMETSERMAHDYLRGTGNIASKVDSLIRWQNTKCATTGFLTGLGGIITLPITVPADLASTLYVQLRMIATIAYMGGYDVRDDKVKTLIYICLVGNGALEILKSSGVVLGRKLAENAIKQLSSKTIVTINKKVGTSLVTKFGEKGVINLGRGIPFVGAFIGATINILATDAIGEAAKKVFIVNNEIGG